MRVAFILLYGNSLGERRKSDEKAHDSVSCSPCVFTVAFFAVPIIAAEDVGPNYGRMAKFLPSNGEISGWIHDLWKIGIKSKYGYRMPGTPESVEGAKYVLKKFQEFGLENTFLEPTPLEVCFPDKWSLKIKVGGKTQEIPSYFLRYTAFTPPEGIKTQMVYVGKGTKAEFDAAKNTVGIAGKIVAVDVFSAGFPYKALTGFDWPNSEFTYDPENTLPGSTPTGNWPLANLDTSYKLAIQYGAVGYVGIMDAMWGKVNQYLHWYANDEIPGLSISPDDGEYLRSLLAGGPVETTMVHTGVRGVGQTYTVYGFLPGRRADEIIQVVSHHDGWAVNEASGVSVVMAIAKYFSQFPKESRERTLMFVAFGSHFGKKAEWNTYPCLAYDLLPNTVVANGIEMVGAETEVIDGELFKTGLISPRVFELSGPVKCAVNPTLLSFAKQAITKYDLDRSAVGVPIIGEIMKYQYEGIPVINHISENHPQFTYADTPQTVMISALRPTAAAFIDIIKNQDVTPKILMEPVDTSPLFSYLCPPR